VVTARRLLPFGPVLILGACASGPTPDPAAIVVPGSGKDFAAFQEDDTICRRHVVANTGHGDLAPPQTPVSNAATAGTTGESGAAAGAPGGPGAAATKASDASAPVPPDAIVPNQLGYLECMAARDDTVLPEPIRYGESANWYGYAYPYNYPWPYSRFYPYDFYAPYEFYGGGFIGVFGDGFHDSDFHRRFFRDGGVHRRFVQVGGANRGGGHEEGVQGGGGHP
jgi:hypothetical protein